MSVLKQYEPFFKKWSNEAGPRPTVQEITAIHDSGCVRAGTKDALALAMALRKDGTTQPQIVSVLGGPHRNKLRDVIQNGVAKRVAMASNEKGHTVYKITLTGKVKAVKKTVTAKPDKAKGGKPDKAPAKKPVDKPAGHVEQPQAEAPATA